MRLTPLTLGRQALLAAAAAACATGLARPVLALSLAERLSSHSAKALSKPLFNFAAGEAAYPEWLLGTWRASLTFDGYELPAKDLLTRDEVFAEPTVPGLQKCSVALIPDVGKEGVQFEMRWVRASDGAVREDRAANLGSAIAGGLGYGAVERVEYKLEPMLPNPFGINPNRLSIVFVPGRTLNAERIELFANAREWEAPAPDLFVSSEYLRQVTFSSSKTGVPRQVSGEYAHYFTFRRVADGQVEASVLTAAYTEPLQQERLFIKAPTRPILIYSHRLTLERVGEAAALS